MDIKGVNMHFKSYISFILILILFASSKCGNSINENQLNNEVSAGKDRFLKDVEELDKDFFENYWQLEKMVLKQLKKEGPEYFIENNCYDILGKFESTLRVYCQICEKLNVGNTTDLLTSYLHLNDVENVKKQYDLMQNDQNAFIYKEFYKYKDSGKILEGEYVSIKYDERVEEFATAVFAHVNSIENFITQEWNGLLPPKVRVILLYSDGPGPYNVNLNETYLPVKSRPLSSSIEVAGHIVHETFHLVNTNLIEQKSDFEIGMEINSFKFLDEGRAQLIESKFMNKFNENRTTVDAYSREIMLANSFDLKDLKSKWTVLFSSQEINIYPLAYSFSYFLEEKYGEERLKALFLPTANIPEDSWLTYVENYFGSSMDSLIEEWKQKLIQ